MNRKKSEDYKTLKGFLESLEGVLEQIAVERPEAFLIPEALEMGNFKGDMRKGYETCKEYLQEVKDGLDDLSQPILKFWFRRFLRIIKKFFKKRG